MTPAPSSPKKSAWDDTNDSPSRKTTTVKDESPVPNRDSTNSAQPGPTAKRGSIFQSMLGRKSGSQRKGDHRWDGLNEDMIDLPSPPGKVVTLVIPSILTGVAVVCLIFFFAQYPQTNEASKEGTCHISGFVAGTDCVDCRLSIDIDGSLKGDIQVTFKKQDGEFVPENKAFECCPRDEKAGCCGWNDVEANKFCDVVMVKGSLEHCNLGPWQCVYSVGPGNSAQNIQHGTKAGAYLLLILGCVLLFTVMLLVKFNNYTYEKRINIAHTNMIACEQSVEENERKASKDKTKAMTDQLILVKHRKTESPGVQEIHTESLKRKKGEEPKSPWSAPAKMAKSRSFESPSAEKSPKKSKTGSKDITVEIKGRQPEMGSPSQSSLAQRRGVGFNKAPMLDDVTAPHLSQTSNIQV